MSAPPPPTGSQESPPPLRQDESDQTGGVIPYKNPKALTSYYLGIFSLIPVLGLILGIVAFCFGLAGWKAYRAKPAIRGQIHCWIGMLLGGGIALLHLIGIGFLVSAMTSR